MTNTVLLVGATGMLGGRIAAHVLDAPGARLRADSLRLANRLVGNPESAACVETTMLGVDLRLDLIGHPPTTSAGRWIAVTGAPSPLAVDGRPVATDRPVWLPVGSVVSVGTAVQGLRAYLAISGGVAVPQVLGSRSADLLSGLGPAPLRQGDRLPIGVPLAGPAPVDVAPRPLLPAAIEPAIVPGPRDDWFAADALSILTTQWYTVGTNSNRIGVRLEGPALPRSRTDELPSEGVALGALQVPPAGQPIVHLADHPTTGGYPIIGVVHADDLWMVAQARPGTQVRFRRQV